MANDDHNNNGSEMHHIRRDTREAESNAQLAKWLSILALIASSIALWVAVSAMNKAGEAQSSANRNTEKVQQVN